MNIGQALAVGLLAASANGNPAAGAEMQAMFGRMAERAKNERADKQTAQYVQALVANGMDPNLATIMAADPGEMAKHIGTRFDAATVDEGSSRLTPNLNGTLSTFTAPKTFQNKADVVQMPGQQGVTQPFDALGVGGSPQSLGVPQSILGLRTEEEQYASQFGAPGTPGFQAALKDAELKAYGPAAQSMLGQRLQSQQSIAADRNATSRANTQYRVDHPAPHLGRPSNLPTPTGVIGSIMEKQAAGQPLTPAEQSTLKDYRTHYKPQSGAVQISPNEPVAVGPHGEKLVVRNGKWVPAK